MKKLLLVLCLFLISIMLTLQTQAKEVLSDFPALKPIVWDWSKVSYLDENNKENKQKISDAFKKVLNDEEKALNTYLSDNTVSLINKERAFLKHMNNVEAVSQDLAQVVDWILYNNENLPEPRGNTGVLREMYGIQYFFKSKLTQSEGERYYSYGIAPIKLLNYPMVEMEYGYKGTELHIVPKINKDFYIKKYSEKLDEKTIETYKNTEDLSTLNYSEDNLISLILNIVGILFVIITLIVGIFFIKKHNLHVKFKDLLVKKSSELKEILSPKLITLKEKTIALAKTIFNFFKRKEVLISLTVVILSTFAIAFYSANSLPKCDSKFAEEQVIAIIKEHEGIYKNNSQRVGAFKMHGFVPKSYDKSIKKYTCDATAVMYPQSGSKLFYIFPLRRIAFDVYYEIYKERGQNMVQASWSMLPIEPEDIDRN